MPITLPADKEQIILAYCPWRPARQSPRIFRMAKDSACQAPCPTDNGGHDRWEKPLDCGAEGATAPETLRQKDRYHQVHSEEPPDIVAGRTEGASEQRVSALVKLSGPEQRGRSSRILRAGFNP